jgi:NTP pyrophosphatase (non-canonical NTP hydrolase)
MLGTQLDFLTARARQVMDTYRIQYPDVRMDSDYLPLKITEEWGECMQSYLMLTNRGRQKDKSKEEIRDSLSNECADVFGYLLLFAEREGIDLDAALTKKWFAHIT